MESAATCWDSYSEFENSCVIWKRYAIINKANKFLRSECINCRLGLTFWFTAWNCKIYITSYNSWESTYITKQLRFYFYLNLLFCKRNLQLLAESTNKISATSFPSLRSNSFFHNNFPCGPLHKLIQLMDDESSRVRNHADKPTQSEAGLTQRKLIRKRMAERTAEFAGCSTN